MKLLCTILFFVSAFTIDAQTNWETIIKQNNVRNYMGHMGGKSVNTCQNVKGIPHHTLSLAIKYDSQILIDHILRQEDLDLSSDCSDKTILMYAIEYGSLDIVKSLIEKGADLNQKSSQGKTALEYARKFEKREIYDYIKSL